MEIKDSKFKPPPFEESREKLNELINEAVGETSVDGYNYDITEAKRV